MGPHRWQVGRPAGRGVYRDFELLARAETPAAAELLVATLNRADWPTILAEATAIEDALAASRREVGRERWDIADVMAALRPFLTQPPGGF